MRPEKRKHTSKRERHQTELPRRTAKAPTQALRPIRDTTLITEKGIASLPIEELSNERVGCKAYGLSSIPSEWVPPFVVVAASCFEGPRSDETFDALVLESLEHVGGTRVQRVMVRSSGTLETIRNRGQLPSASCLPGEIATTIRRLSKEPPPMSSGRVHWIVQKYIDSYEKGHLSNERRLKFEKRDWAIEVEPKEERPGYTSSMGIRPWRDGRELLDLSLSCASHLEISLRLRRVAMWASKLSSRTHFEWVWDGKAICIVQVDAEQAEPGTNPRKLLPKSIQALHLSSLKTFRPANQEDHALYGKLRNAKLYGELGYKMPEFFVLDDPEILDHTLAGRLPRRLEKDLAGCGKTGVWD